ncbi:MAG: hypothetical protein LC797_13070 [Chloroflexi bacterium]|nr:hypothetical protein [Chloroflexota bacterium]
MAGHLFSSGLEHEFDFAVAQEFDIDHSILVPLHFLTPSMQIPIVPIFTNAVVHPLRRRSAAMPWVRWCLRQSSQCPVAHGWRCWAAGAFARRGRATRAARRVVGSARWELGRDRTGLFA